MDAGAVIVEAHAELERLFAAYEGIDGSPAARRRTFGVIAGALGVHAAIAGELLYPALQAQTSRYDGDIRRQLEQAHVLDLLAAELAATVPTDPGYHAKVQVLQQVFRLHVRDEGSPLGTAVVLALVASLGAGAVVVGKRWMRR